MRGETQVTVAFETGNSPKKPQTFCLKFVEHALKADHPMSNMLALPEERKFAVSQMSKLSPYEVARRRADFFMYWSGRAKELEDEEAKLRSGMDKVASNAVRNKKLVSFDEMLQF